MGGIFGHHAIDYRTMLYRWQALFESVARDPAIVDNPTFRIAMEIFDRDLVRLERTDPTGAHLLKARIDVQTGASGPNIERVR
jgi:hypothetical protein